MPSARRQAWLMTQLRMTAPGSLDCRRIARRPVHALPEFSLACGAEGGSPPPQPPSAPPPAGPGAASQEAGIAFVCCFVANSIVRPGTRVLPLSSPPSLREVLIRRSACASGRNIFVRLLQFSEDICSRSTLGAIALCISKMAAGDGSTTRRSARSATRHWGRCHHSRLHP